MWRPPLLEEITDVFFAITSPEDIPELRIVFKALEGAQLATSDTVLESSIPGGEAREFRSKVRFASSPAIVTVEARGHFRVKDGTSQPVYVVRSFRVTKVDWETESARVLERMQDPIPDPYYDMLSGRILGQLYGWGLDTRHMIERLKKFEPRLTDWEAVYLHRDAIKAYRKGAGGDNDERIQWLLENGWLERQRKGERAREKWFQELLEVRLGQPVTEAGCIDVHFGYKLIPTDAGPEETGRNAEPQVEAESAEPVGVSPIWEQEFDKDILAVGMDEERFDPDKQNIRSCLRWLLLDGGGVCLYDTAEAGVGERAAWLHEGGIHISDDTRFFAVTTPYGFRGRGGGYYVLYWELFDWGGRKMWRSGKAPGARPYVFNNGSSVFLRFRDCNWTKELEELRFFGRSGWAGSTYTLPEPAFVFGLGVSTSYIGFVTAAPVLYVFDKWGELTWMRSRIVQKWACKNGQEEWFDARRVVVTDRGEALLVLQTAGPSLDSRMSAYDAGGVLKNTFGLEHTGHVESATACGRLAFLCMSQAPGGSSRLLCYDFEKHQVRFTVEETEHDFENLDVDGASELAAVLATKPDGNTVVRVYDFRGDYRDEIGVKRGSSDRTPWFKLLNDALIIAEGKKLKLYALDSSDD
jgi:hypothetical protein